MARRDSTDPNSRPPRMSFDSFRVLLPYELSESERHRDLVRTSSDNSPRALALSTEPLPIEDLEATIGGSLTGAGTGRLLSESFLLDTLDGDDDVGANLHGRRARDGDDCHGDDVLDLSIDTNDLVGLLGDDAAETQAVKREVRGDRHPTGHTASATPKGPFRTSLSARRPPPLRACETSFARISGASPRSADEPGSAGTKRKKEPSSPLVTTPRTRANSNNEQPRKKGVPTKKELKSERERERRAAVRTLFQQLSVALGFSKDGDRGAIDQAKVLGAAIKLLEQPLPDVAAPRLRESGAGREAETPQRKGARPQGSQNAEHNQSAPHRDSVESIAASCPAPLIPEPLPFNDPLSLAAPLSFSPRLGAGGRRVSFAADGAIEQLALRKAENGEEGPHGAVNSESRPQYQPLPPRDHGHSLDGDEEEADKAEEEDGSTFLSFLNDLESPRRASTPRASGAASPPEIDRYASAFSFSPTVAASGVRRHSGAAAYANRKSPTLDSKATGRAKGPEATNHSTPLWGSQQAPLRRLSGSGAVGPLLSRSNSFSRKLAGQASTKASGSGPSIAQLHVGTRAGHRGIFEFESKVAEPDAFPF